MQRTVVAGSIATFAVALVATLIVLPAALPAGGRSRPSEDAATFLTRIVGYIVSDDYARAWPSLFPEQQSVAPRDEYVSCERLSPVGWTLRSADVVRVTEGRRRISGASGPTAVTSVTLRLRIASVTLHTEGSFTHTFSAVQVGSRWAWILTPSRYELYRSNTCATGGSPVPAAARPPAGAATRMANMTPATDDPLSPLAEPAPHPQEHPAASRGRRRTRATGR